MKYDITELLAGIDPPDLSGEACPDMARLRESVLARVRGAPVKRPRRLVRTLLVAAAVAALLGITAIAAELGAFEWLRSAFDPAYIDEVEPVEQSVTVDGIRLGVIAAGQYEGRAVIYVSLRDAAGRGRVREDTSFLYHGGPDDFGSMMSRNSYYDAETGTKVFEIYAVNSDEGLENRDVMLEVEEIYYNWRDMDIAVDGFDPASACADGERIGSRHDDPARAPAGRLTGGRLCEVPGTDMYVSAVGEVDGYLAVQIGVNACADEEYFAGPYLRAPDGSRVEHTQHSDGITLDDGTAIRQYYFDVDAGTLEGFTLGISGRRCNAERDGWKLGFSFGETRGVIEAVADVSYDGVQFSGVSLMLSPLGLRISGSGVPVPYSGQSLQLPASVETEDGVIDLCTARLLPSDRNGGQNGEYSAFWETRVPVDHASVTAIRIGDTRIELEQ